MATPIARRAVVGRDFLWPVIAGKDDDRFFTDAKIIHSVENLPDTVVHLHDGISKVTVPCLSREVGMWGGRQVHLCEGNKGEERPPSFRLALDEINGAPSQFRINVTPRN